MSDLSYSLIDDDQIDDQESMLNVGKLIIDLESDLEKEKFESEQASARPSSASASSSYAPKASSSSNSTSSTITGKHHRSSGKHSNNTSNSNSNNSVNSNSNNNGSHDLKQISNSSASINNNNNNNGHSASKQAVFKSSADERGELKMRITRETKPGKSEHKIVTSPSHKSPTSSSANSINIHPTASDNLHESSSISSTKECGTSTSIGTITEPDCLGPCEPGTSVTLEGIVWQETESGILVVNITWRGKTYVGALLDCTKHDWAPPRLCDSPASDIDSKAHKGVRTKRIVTRSNGIGLDEKNLQTTGKLRNGKGRRIPPPSENAPCNKRQRESEKSNETLTAQTEATSTLTNISTITNSETPNVSMNANTEPTSNESISTTKITPDKAGPNSPMLISCTEPNCSKKFRNANALAYHHTHAHCTDGDPSNTQDNNCSSSSKEKVRPNDCDPPEQPEEVCTDKGDQLTLNKNESQPTLDVKLQDTVELRRTPSPRLTSKAEIKSEPIMNNEMLEHDIASRNLEVERRNFTQPPSNLDASMSPIGNRQFLDHGQGPSNNHSHQNQAKSSSSSKQQSNLAQMPITEEGMKPSGTSTGPPPAPHQANCYFNSAFLSNSFHPYMMGPYFNRPPLPLYDPLTTSTSSANAANAAFLSRLMNPVRPPPPDSPSRLLSPSVSKNLPFPPFKPDGMLPIPTSQIGPIPNLPPMTNPPLGGNSTLLRMPSQGDPLLPPNSQPFPPPVGMNPVLGLPNPAHPQLGPMGGPQVPGLIEDPMSKQFPRRFN